MSDNRRYAQLQPFNLAGSGVSVSATSVVLTSMIDIDGNPLVMASAFGTKGYITLEPGSLQQEEQISFTGITQNTNGTATLTGVSNVAFLYPYTETAGVAKSHAGGVVAVVSNTSGFYNDFANKNDTETITQEWLFPSAEADRPKAIADTDAIGAADYVTFGQLSRTAMSGTVNASETVNGVIQLATNAQMGTHTSLGSTGARLVAPNDQLTSTSVGVGSANKIITLDGTGALDSSLLKNASTTVRGQVQIATAAQTVAGTAVGSTGAELVPDNANFKAASSTTLSNDLNKVPVMGATSVIDQSFMAASFTSGEAIAIGAAVYIKAADGKAYNTLGTGDESTYSFTGIAVSAAGASGVLIRVARPGQVATGLSGLTAGSYYFITDVAGVIDVTPGTRFAKIGQALSTTTLRVVEPKFVAQGTTSITATGNTVVVIGFYPAKIQIRAGGNSFSSGLSVGSDANTCIQFLSTKVFQSDASHAWNVYDFSSSVTASVGTVSAKSATGFTLNDSSHAGVEAVQIQWEAWSE